MDQGQVALTLPGLQHRLRAERVAPSSQEGFHQGQRRGPEGQQRRKDTSGGDQRQRLLSGGQEGGSGRAQGGPCGQSPPYLLGDLRAEAAPSCPGRLWLPGIVGRRQPSLGHLLSAGQLPPAELFVRLLVHHQQPSLPLHGLDPLHHLGQVGGGRSRPALQAAHG